MRALTSKLGQLSKTKGFSLVELLIAGVLGLILLGGVIAVFLGSKRSFTMQDDLATLQTDGRFAMMFLERNARNAGWFDGVAPSLESAVDFANSSEGGAGASDQVAFQQEAPAGTAIDCNGANVAGTVLRNEFFVNGTTLLCLGNGGGAAQPIVENVESFQVLYGVDTDGDGVINRYIDANAVSAGAQASNVVAVQLSLLMRTEQAVAESNVAANLAVLDQNLAFNDQFIRRAFTKTVMMPNQAFVVINN